MTPNYFVGVPIDGTGWYDDRFLPPFEHIWAVHPRDLHMTVAFLGSVTEQEAKAGFSLCKGLSTTAFDCMLQSIVPLGKPGPFSALTLGIGDGREKAVKLLEDLKNPILEAAGLPPSTRPPLPHVTVTRARRKAGKSGKLAALKWLKELVQHPIPVQVRELALYTWAEDRTEARYTIINRIGLK